MIGVFGGSGFIGRNLVDCLNEEQRSFRVFSRRKVVGLHAETKIIDFEQPESYREYLKGLETVILLVSASVPSTFANDIASEVERNVLPYSRFLRAARSTGIRHIVYVSSGGAVYGQPIAPIITEEHPTNPISPYGCAKLMIEEMIRTMSTEGGWTYTILRASNPIGRYQSSEKGQGLVARALDAAVSNTALDIWGDGTSLRDYIDVRDLCDVIARSLTAEVVKNEIYNVGSGSVYSINEIVEICSSVSRTEIKKNYISQKSFLVKDVKLSIDKAMRDLNWKPKFDVWSSIESEFTHTIALIPGYSAGRTSVV
ncbi:NAD-dependent epimerase/dehydratase family protein [Mesorhizobium sp. M1E.F.Ca.ET.045.02.1.1]|uniref:NAD-dependent epimerase/dehydratase family protein n=1 Tax=Mesorhizobium sp. M1E.F.Ca.ET.045.02.1.1 TaxID=2493672 RepID=UPI000F75BAE0|nr:NAD-dependent epimerase/dehydratase family protein [Mesorhizobium sp. M1E.F.Ca.ET.045.02.1.1]AZO25103.1 NAD-dependent epimerase/dehydratase family protein [Mesorhizobium sp. M1E.F.Ca.ET.045.02.1.1]TKB17955.1 MAG: NAD-dependent epimerase/dehydratase family protein [Mesorhizobium sp.]